MEPGDAGRRDGPLQVCPYPARMSSDLQVDERVALVALLQNRQRGRRWADITADVLEAGSAIHVWNRHAPPAALMPAPGELEPLDAAAAEIERWTADGTRLLTILDGEYPSRLRGIHQAPPVVFTRGQLVVDDRAVSVVGSRKASDQGLDIATRVARELVADGVTVMAGLALGIDTAAHTGALEAGGRTVAVIGTGITQTYPAANRALHAQIAERGLLLSQFWPDAPPQRHNFLMRNATMSGYGLATVVVEAGEQSGARAQARMAVEHGRPVILTELVVTRNTWAREMIGRPGVHLATSVQEVITAVRNVVSQEAAVESRLRELNFA